MLQQPQSHELLRLWRRVSELIRQNELAAVIVHLNDTYMIESDDDEIPGMARVARLVKKIRSLVRDGVGEDRVLVVHSGDFLSPSYMSITGKTKGKQIVELMNHCEMDYVTLGNHEFEFGADVLAERMEEARFMPILTNLTPPPGFPKWMRFARWPEKNPFLTVLGIAGEDTLVDAPADFTKTPWEKALSDVLDNVLSEPQLGALVVLSHMNRNEDKKLQLTISERWPKSGSAYVFGGHDHDIDWGERYGSVLLAKNLSNCRSVTVALVTKSAVAAPFKEVIARIPHRSYGDGRAIRSATIESPEVLQAVDELFFASEDTFEDKRQHLEKVEAEDRRRQMEGWPTFQEAVDQAVRQWEQIAEKGIREDFVEAFARTIRDAATLFGEDSVCEDAYYGESDRTLIGLAESAAQNAAFRTGLLRLTANTLMRLNPDPDGKAAVDRWVALTTPSAHAAPSVVADFSAVCLPDFRMDATEKSLRTRSTDFGNFVADSVRAATGADIALINSGAFRIDRCIRPRITSTEIAHTFLYRGDICELEMDLKELVAFYEHAAGKRGGGAFLQVSESLEMSKGRTGNPKVAVLSYLMSDPHDGYQGLLANSRKCAPGEIASMGLLKGPLIDLIMKGASQVDYCDDLRLRAANPSKSGLGEGGQLFVDTIDRYLKACRISVSAQKAMEYLRVVSDTGALSRKRLSSLDQLSEEARRAWNQVMVVTRDLIAKNEVIWIRTELYRELAESRERYERGVPYHRCLTDSVDNWMAWARSKANSK